MWLYVLLAVFNGGIISLSRMINGRLGSTAGSLYASLWNHLVGFLFLSLVLISSGKFVWSADIPLLAYLGGVAGALFVAVNSYVLPRLGNAKTALLVISGQMIFGFAWDIYKVAEKPDLVKVAGITLILGGVFCTIISRNVINKPIRLLIWQRLRHN